MTTEELARLVDFFEENYLLLNKDLHSYAEHSFKEEIVALAREGLSSRLLTSIYGESSSVYREKLANWAEDVAQPALDFISSQANMLSFNCALKALKSFPKRSD